MDFNARASSQYRTTTTQQHKKRHEEDSESFMRLPDKEIAGCISDIAGPFEVADLQKPNPQQIQAVFELFAELFMNATRDTVDPAMRAAAEDVCGEYADIVPVGTRNLMGFFVSLRTLLVQCKVNDFSFQDLVKPTHDRLVKIFSHIINFIRFRESQTAIIDEHFNRTETTKARIEQLYNQNQEMESRLAEMKRSRKEMEGPIRQKAKKNEELKARLLELGKGQERVVARLERVREDKARCTTTLKDKSSHLAQVRQECARLRPYVDQSPAALQTSLSELSASLQTDRSQIDSLDRRARALQTSAEAIATVTGDVASGAKLLEEIRAELDKEEEEASRASRHRDALSERSNNVREVERAEHLLRRQLAKWNERTDKLRQGAEEKTKAAKEKMEDLRGVHRELTEERGGKGREMETRRVRIEQAEKKMADLKENIELEVRNAWQEWVRMESHIGLYIKEMEQCL